MTPADAATTTADAAQLRVVEHPSDGNGRSQHGHSLRARLGRRRFVRRYFEQLENEYASLCTDDYRRQTADTLSQLRARNATAPSWENNYRFEYVIWGGLDAPVLKQRVYLEKDRLRMLIGASNADAAVAAFTKVARQHQQERSMALGLLCEVQRTRMLQNEFAKLRSWLIVTLLFVGGVCSYLVASQLYDSHSALGQALPPAGYSVLAGLLGGYFSVLLRLGRLQWSHEYTANHHQVDRLFLNVVPVLGLATFEGAVAALVLYTLFLSGVIEGSIFPHFSSVETLGNWQASASWLWLAPEDSYGMAKLVVWSIFAGFSERLVPDILTSLSKNAASTAASSNAANTATTNNNAQEPRDG